MFTYANILLNSFNEGASEVKMVGMCIDEENRLGGWFLNFWVEVKVKATSKSD
jgi:hypothetical protein